METPVERGSVNRASYAPGEWRWVWGWTLAVAALASLPYLWALWAAPPHLTFGGFLVNAQDGNSYLAKLRQGYDGEWLFRLPFTPEDQRGIFVFTFYLGLGHIGRLLGLPLIVVFHLARAASGAFLLLTLYRLAAELTPDRAARRWAFWIAALGGGLAALSLLIGRNSPDRFVPVDLFVPEAYGYYSILANPHFPLAAGLMAWAVLWAFRPPSATHPLFQFGLAAAIGLGVASLAPHLVLVVGSAIGAGMLAAWPPDRSMFGRAAALAGAMAALLLYDLWAMRTDPAVAAWARQNVTPSPPLIDYLLGFGIWLPLAGVGLGRAVLSRGATGNWPAPAGFRPDPLVAALAGWMIAAAALVYVPHPLQRRFVGGVFVPLDVLAAVGVAWLVAQIGSRKWTRRALVAGVIALGFSSNMLLMAALFSAPATGAPMVYLADDEVAALRWLERRAARSDVILADPRLGNFVPGWTGARVVYGHPMETIDAARRLAQVEAYYEGASGGETVLLDYDVKYIIGGPPLPGWSAVFESGRVRVYGR